MKTLRIFAVTLGLALVGAASAITSGDHSSVTAATLAPQVVATSPAPADAAVADMTKTSPVAMALPILAVLVVVASGPFVRRAFRI